MHPPGSEEFAADNVICVVNIETWRWHVSTSSGPSVDSLSPLPVLVPCPQFRLQQLAGGRVRQFSDEDEIIRQLPFGKLCAQEFAQLIGGRVSAVFQRNYGQRTLLPFGMRRGDHAGF